MGRTFMLKEMYDSCNVCYEQALILCEASGKNRYFVPNGTIFHPNRSR